MWAFNSNDNEIHTFAQDEVAEWLRRWTRNPLGSAREGSNPFLVDAFKRTWFHFHHYTLNSEHCPRQAQEELTVWFRRRPRKPLGAAREGSNHFCVDDFTIRW